MSGRGIDKKQDANQVKGRWGELLAAFAFPDHWVVRPLPQDYGIDLQVEIFNPEPGPVDGRRFRSTGGHFSCQVKTTDLASPAEDKVSFSVSTADLHLSELMGAASPLLLLLVERPTRSIRYLCLTDYVDKVLNLEQPKWREQTTATVYIPRRNEIRLDLGSELEAHWQYFAGLGLRAKLYAAANQFRFLGRRLDRAVEGFVQNEPSSSFELRDLARRAESVNAAWQEALAAVEGAGLRDLRASDSPVAGLFENLREMMDAAQGAYEPSRTEILRVIETETNDEDETLAAQRDFEVAAIRASSYFATATAIGDIYEDTHRLVGLSPEPTVFDIVT